MYSSLLFLKVCRELHHEIKKEGLQLRVDHGRVLAVDMHKYPPYTTELCSTNHLYQVIEELDKSNLDLAAEKFMDSNVLIRCAARVVIREAENDNHPMEQEPMS